MKKQPQIRNDIYDTIGVPVAIIEPDFTVVSLNRQALQALGAKEEDVIGKKCYSLFHKSDASPGNCPLQKMLKTGITESSEMVVETLNGTFIVTCAPVFHDSGKLKHIVHTLIDLSAQKAVITEREQMQKAMKESDALLRLLTDIAPAFIAYVTSDDLCYRYANKKYEDAFGLTADQIIGRHVKEVIHESNYEFALKYIEEVKKGNACSYENEFQFKDEKRCVQVNFSPDFDERGKVKGIVVMGYDITGRKRAEEALRGSEGRFRAVLDAAPFPVAVADAQDDRILFWSRGAHDLFGHTAPTAAEWYEIAYPDPDYRREVISRWKPFLEIARQSRRAEHTGEYRITCKDGSIRICELYACFLADNLIITFNDITERKRSERAIQESEERMALVLEGSQLGFWDWNIETGVVRRNVRWAEMLGYTLEEIEHSVNQWTDLHHPEDRAAAVKSIQDHLQGLTPVHRIEYRMRAKDGQYRWILDQARVVKKDARGNPLRMCGTHTDITDIKTAEKDKEKLQQQLLQSQKMEAIGQLAGGIAHDFNNMLTVIMGNANLMQISMKPDDKWFEECTEIMHAAQRSRDLTMKLLTFSRREKLNVANIEMGQLVQGLASMLQRSMDKNIEIVTSPGAGIVVRADKNQLEHALMNICMNARDAMPEGGRIMVQCQAVALDENDCKANLNARAGQYCMIRVSDTGIGMHENILKKILEPFYTTKGPDKGTGLGLSVAHGIITSHDGFMDIASEPGQGTTVTVYIPVAEAGAVQTQPLPGDEIRGGAETILVVDDEEAVLGIAARALQNMGYRVYKARGGAEALEIFRDHIAEITLVVLDLIMPEMDGAQVFAELKALNPGVRVVLASGFSADGKAGRLMAEGANAFVQKPFTLVSFCNTIRDVIESV